MGIRPGQEWGEIGELPAGARIVESDAELAEIHRARREGRPSVAELDPDDRPVVGLVAGDLARTLGAGTRTPDDLRAGPVTLAPIDVGEALIDGVWRCFVAHLVARPSWWRGRAWMAMNAEHLGRWDVAPRAHPGDGLLDIVEADVSPTQRLAVARRLPTGTHLPHPQIKTSRIRATQIDLGEDWPIYLDGQPAGRARTLSVRVRPAALVVAV